MRIPGLGTSRTLIWISLIALAVRIAAFIYELHSPLAYNYTLQNYVDFDHYYLTQVFYIYIGYLPYRDFTYNYPPLFIYTLYAFYLLSHKIVALPIILSDAMSAPLIYLLVKANFSQRIATAAGMVYILSPYFLLYEGFTWLSEQPMLFFLLLSVYLLQRGKPAASSLALAVSILMKQQALFVLPAYLFWMFKRQRLPKVIGSLSLLVLVPLLVSIPFLVLTPGPYITDLTLQSTDLGIGPALAFSLPSSSDLLPDLLVVLILVAAVLEFFLIRKRLAPTFSFALSFAVITIPLFVLGALNPYKYYLAPMYALLLASSDDYVTLAVASLTPIVLLAASVYATLVLPVAELNFFALYWFLKGRTPRSTVIPSNPITA